MCHVGIRIQSRQNDNAANNDLSEYTSHETPRKPQQIAATWTAEMRQKNRCDHTERYDSRKKPIELFYCRMARRHIDKLGVIAIGPIATAKTRVGEAHQSSCKHNHAERAERGPAHDSVGLP